MHHTLAHGRVKLTGRRVAGPRIAVELVDGWVDRCKSLSPSERQQYIDASGYLPDDILTKVDRASMAVSLEVRVPVLDHRIAEFAFRLPPSMKTDSTQTKRILREILGRHVPPSKFERPKRGFGAPVRSWLKGPLKEWAEDLMSRSTTLRHGVADPDVRGVGRHPLGRSKLRRFTFRRIALAAWCDTHP